MRHAKKAQQNEKLLPAEVLDATTSCLFPPFFSIFCRDTLSLILYSEFNKISPSLYWTLFCNFFELAHIFILLLGYWPDCKASPVYELPKTVCLSHTRILRGGGGRPGSGTPPPPPEICQRWDLVWMFGG